MMNSASGMFGNGRERDRHHSHSRHLGCALCEVECGEIAHPCGTGMFEMFREGNR